MPHHKQLFGKTRITLTLSANLFLMMLTTQAVSQTNHTILAKAKLQNKYGCIDTTGNEIIPLKYDDIGFWGSNLIPVNVGAKEIDYTKEGGKWGYCNNNGLLTIPLQFTKAETFNEGIAAIKLNQKWGFIDTTGKITIQPRFDEVKYFKEGLCAVAINKKWGFINQKGEEIINLEYGEACAFKDGIASVFVGQQANEEWEEPKGHYCLIDKMGKKLTDVKFVLIWNFYEGLAKVEIKDSTDSYSTKKGFINMKGEIVVPPVYDIADDFSDGFAAVGIKLNEDKESYLDEKYRYGFVNTKGEETIKLQFKKANKFFNGRAVVSIGEQRKMGFIKINPKDNSFINHEDWPKYALIDKNGLFILNFDWSHLTPIDSNLFIAQRAKFIGDGVIDINGKVVIPFNYRNLSYLGENLFVSDDGDGNAEEVQLFTIDNKLLFKTKKFAMPSPQYEFGLLHVRTNRLRKSGFVDINGNWVIRDKYDMVWDFTSTWPPDK